MDHSYYRDRISAYVDNELPPQERKIVQQHISECQDCRDLRAELEKLDRFVQQRSMLAGKEYWEQSAQKIEQRLGFTGKTEIIEVTRSRWRGLVPKLVAVAASIAVLGFIALYEGDIYRRVLPPAVKSTMAPQAELAKPPPAVGADTPDLSMPAESDTEAASVIAEEPAKKQGKAEFIAEEAAVSAESDRKTAAGERETEGEEIEAGKVEMPPIPQTVNGMPRKVESVVAGQPIQITVKPDTGKLDYRSNGKKAAPVAREEEPVVSQEEVSLTAKAGVSKESRESLNFQPPVIASMAKTISAADSVLFLPADWLQDSDLKQWRQRRDSLQTLYAELTSPHRALSEAKSRQREIRPSIEEIEGRLLYSYYQVARLTQDEKERAAVVSYLTGYAQEGESLWKDLALRYLEELSRSEK